METQINNQSLQCFQKYLQPICTSGSEFITCYYDPENFNIDQQKYFQQIQAKLDMNISQVIKIWYNSNQDIDKKQHPYPDLFVIKFQGSVILQEDQLLSSVKKKFNINIFSFQDCFRIYYYEDCFVITDQSNLSYADWLEKNGKLKCNFNIKIICAGLSHNYYFSMDTQNSTTFQSLAKRISEELDKKKLIQNKQKINQYQIYINENSATRQLVKEEKYENFSYKANYRTYILYKQINVKLTKINQIINPGEIIYVEFPQKLNVKFNYIQSSNKELKIKIKCYRKALNPQKNKTFTKNSKIIQQFTIFRNYCEIQNINIETLLVEQNIEDPHFTSLQLNQIIIRPFQKFNQISKKIKIKNQKELIFVSIPENLLYYKQMYQIKESNYLMDTILDSYKNKAVEYKKTTIPQNFRQTCRTRRDNIIPTLSEDHQKDINFLDPLILYTSPYIYSFFNQLLRQNSISRLKSENYLQNFQYPLSEKIFKSLLKLNNFRGNVFRCSINYNYNYKQNQVVEWNQFNSTSKNIKKAEQFLTNYPNAKDHYLFEIQSYSGKLIDKYSYFTKEQEVILLPYTRFLVKKKPQKYQLKAKDKKLSVTKVQLLELPIPKIIPGNVVVCIDPNINQNSRAFDSIKSKNNLVDFDIIHLKSNQDFKLWLQQYKQVLLLNDTKVHFISNMNRPPNFKQQGIQTLQIIRSFKKDALLVYYIGNVQKTRSILSQNNKLNDKNIIVQSSYKGLQDIFIKRLAK